MRRERRVADLKVGGFVISAGRTGNGIASSANQLLEVGSTVLAVIFKDRHVVVLLREYEGYFIKDGASV